MKAIIWTEYGAPDVLKIKEVKKPIPKDDEVLVRVKAASVMPGDCEIRRFDMHVLFWLPLRLYMGISKPKRPILGMDLAGEVESVGKDVKTFKPDDQIFGNTGIRFGAYAEYACIKDKGVFAFKPSNMSYKEAVTVPTGGLNALHYMRKANIRSGEKILIRGAGGCFGTYAIQLAKLYGAEVTAVDNSDKLGILKPIGADHVLDYTKEDFTKNKEVYDIVFDVVGKGSVSKNMKCLKKNGRYILATPWVNQVLQGIWCSMLSDKKFIFELAKETSEDLVYLKNLIEEGKLKAVVDSSYPMEEIVNAHRYVESGEKKGHVVVSI